MLKFREESNDRNDSLIDDPSFKSSFWCRCLCPCIKKTETFEQTRRRRQSVVQAEKRLQSLEEDSENKETTFDEKYLPLTFVPDVIIEEIYNDSFRSLPYMIHSEAVLLMVDICGFTSLTDTYCQKGVSGIEEFASVLNGYVSLLAAMLIAGGGDILNFAGDAFLCKWEEKGRFKSMRMTVEKAYNCAVALQTDQSLKTKDLNGTLKVKIGIALGEIATWVLGSPSEFLLFVVAGHCVTKVQQAEGKCSAGDITVTKEVFECLQARNANTFKTTSLMDGFVKINSFDVPQTETKYFPNRAEDFNKCAKQHVSMAKTFLIPAVRGVKTLTELSYLSELTMVTILFVALLNVEVEEPKVLDQTFDIVLASAKKLAGTLNKMLLFDKGCTYLIVFGIPGLKHANDAARGVLCAKDIVEKLEEIDIQVSVGVTSGTCFCGIVGHPQRQEYTVIGNRVNMAARIMVYYSDETIAVDVDTFHLSRHELGDNNFVELPTRKMKGIDSAGAIYAYRPQVIKKKSTVVYHMIEDSDLEGSEKEMQRIRNCLIAMSNKEQRSIAKSKNLLPVVVVQGLSGSGKSFLLYLTADSAVTLGYTVVSCCTMQSYAQEPFAVIARLMRRMLGITLTETPFQREQIILNTLSKCEDPQLYLLNHLFHVQFNPPEIVNVDETFRNEQFTRLARTIIRAFCKDTHALIAVDNADYMDVESWHLIRDLAEEENILIIFSLSIDFKEPIAAANVLLLKAYTNINLEVSGDEYFAPLTCWFLGVKAVHTTLFCYLKDKTDGDVQLLKEISLSPIIAQCMRLVPIDSLDKERLEKEFYVNKLHSFDDEDRSIVLACDLKPGVDLKKLMIPTNINDAVKESLNNLTVQDRLLLKRASVLGPDFDQHALEAISPGMKADEVLTCIKNLTSNHVFTSACTTESMGQMAPESARKINLEEKDLCTCFRIYEKAKRKDTKEKNTTTLSIGPYHRLKFRTNVFRSCMIAYMTEEQQHKMHMETADELESNGIECASCKSKRIENMKRETSLKAASYPIQIDVKNCVCLMKRPKLFIQVAQIYRSSGVKLLPIYFLKKAAQACNEINHPIQALNYANIAYKTVKDLNLSKENFHEEENYFEPLILDIALKKTVAESFILLGDTYQAATYALKALDMLGLEAVLFHGVYNPKEFKDILPRFSLLHAEYITKLIGVLAKTYLMAGNYKLTLEILKIEYVALCCYPIDFIQVLTHMVTLYKCRHYLNRREKMRSLESNIFRTCHERLSNFDIILDLIEIKAIANAYLTLIKINLSQANISRAQKIAKETIRILKSVNDRTTIPNVELYQIELFYHDKMYQECLTSLQSMYAVGSEIGDPVIIALYFCMLSALIIEDRIESTEPEENEIDTFIEECNKYAREWAKANVQSLRKDFAFYISSCLADWSWYSLNAKDWQDGKVVFNQCFKSAIEFQKKSEKDSYWYTGGFLRFISVKAKLLKEDISDEFKERQSEIEAELLKIKRQVKRCYPIHLKKFNHMLRDLRSLK